MLVVLTSVLCAVGICERSVGRSQAGDGGGASGGVYFLVSHVLGGQAGGAVGLVYSFGQVRLSNLNHFLSDFISHLSY